MATPKMRLLCRSQLMPGESLASLIERLTLRNGYQSSVTILELCNVTATHDLILPQALDWLLSLSALTGIGYANLYAATGYSFASILPQQNSESIPSSAESAGMSPAAGQPAQKHFEHNRRGKFCSACLKESPYHRLLWTLDCVTICIKHRVSLTSGCPICRRDLKVKDIVYRRCHICGADLTTSPCEEIEKNTMDLISQQIMQSWFTGSSVTKEDILRSLCNQPSTILYQVVADFHDWFFNVTQPPLVYKKMRRQTQVSVPTCGFSTEQYANAHHKSWVASFRCISNWPQGFHDLLTGWPSEQGLARERSLAMFRLLFESGVSERWRKPDYAFMRDAFYEHLVTHHEFSYERLFVGAMHNDSNLLDRWEYFTASEAVDRLRLPSYYLDLVCEAAKSRVRIIASHKSQSWVFFEKSYIAMLVAMREALLPVEAIEFILGASENELLSLARSGLLAAVETTVDDGTSSVMFHFGSVQELLLNSNLSERLWSELPTEAFPFLITLSENRNRMRESAYRRVMQWCQALESLEIFSQSDSIKGATVGSLRKLALDMGLPNVEDCGPYRLQLVKTRRAGVLV